MRKLKYNQLISDMVGKEVVTQYTIQVVEAKGSEKHQMAGNEGNPSNN